MSDLICPCVCYLPTQTTVEDGKTGAAAGVRELMLLTVENEEQTGTRENRGGDWEAGRGESVKGSRTDGDGDSCSRGGHKNTQSKRGRRWGIRVYLNTAAPVEDVRDVSGGQALKRQSSFNVWCPDVSAGDGGSK